MLINQRATVLLHHEAGSSLYEGLLTQHEEAWTITYQEDDEAWMTTQTRVSLLQRKPTTMTIVREGDINSQLIFVEGELTTGFYQLPQGRLDLSLTTKKLVMSVEERLVTVTVNAFVQEEPSNFVMTISW